MPISWRQYEQPAFRFFFQAEDGIRDVERSRGLGDVYKRQKLPTTRFTEDMKVEKGRWRWHFFATFFFGYLDGGESFHSVSYTHLTLPTICSV